MKNDVQSKLTNLREARESGDVERTRTNLQAVQEATYRLGELMYQQAEPQEGGTRKDQGDVVDAEFEVVDEDKK